MPLILSGNVASATADAGYTVDNSCRFDSGSSAYMNKTPASDGNRRTWTISFWIKRGVLSGYHKAFSFFDDANNNTQFSFEDSNIIRLFNMTSGAVDLDLRTNQLFRDPSAWYHIVVAVDSTQATDTNRVKIFCNGSQITSFSTETYFDQNTDTFANFDGAAMNIASKDGSNYFVDGYMAEVVMIDGQQLTPSSFGEFDEDSPTIWKPIDVSGLTFGTNGFYLDFEDSADLGADVSGNSNDFTVNNLTSVDQATDTPTNNFCTLNPLEAVTATTTYAEGNTQGTTSNAARATFAVSNGKWYWEHKFVNKEAMGGVMAYDGFAPNDYTINALIQGSNPELVLNGSEQSSWSGDGTPDAMVDNDILNVALDCDNNRIAFGVNGAWLNATDGSGEWSGTTLNYFSITDGYYYSPAFRSGSGANRESHFNFGGCPGFAISSGNSDGNGYGNFEYAVPSGFYSLCTKNLAEYG